MTNLFNRWLPCTTLAAWSAILLYFARVPQSGVFGFLARHTPFFTGRVDAFLIPAFRPYVLIAGLVMLVMALAFLFFPADAACCSANECGHPLSRFAAGRWLTFLVLLVPVCAAAFSSQDAFGKGVYLNRTEITDPTTLGRAPRVASTQPVPSTPAAPDLPLPTNDPSPSQPVAATAPAPASGSPAPTAASSPNDPTPNDYLRRTPEGYIEAEVLDLLYAAQDNTLRKDFDGKMVVLVGQLMPDVSKNAGGNRFKAVRMFMTCCAADARPVATLVEADKLPDLPEMTWVKIVGTATFPVENGRRTAILKAKEVSKAPPPEETMLY